MEDATPLQIAVRNAIAATGKPRDALDAIIGKRLDTKGKVLYDIDRGKSKKPKPDTLAVAEEVLGLPNGTLVNLAHPSMSSIPQKQNPAIDRGDAVPVTALDLSLSMGPGTLIEEFIESEPVYMDLRLLQIITRTPSDRLRLVRGIGHSMEPTLRNGDQVLVDINDRQLSNLGGLYWIDYCGAHGIKRLQPAPRGKVWINSDNPVEPRIEADAEDVRIEGRVIWFAREL